MEDNDIKFWLISFCCVRREFDLVVDILGDMQMVYLDLPFLKLINVYDKTILDIDLEFNVKTRLP